MVITAVRYMKLMNLRQNYVQLKFKVCGFFYQVTAGWIGDLGGPNPTAGHTLETPGLEPFEKWY